MSTRAPTAYTSTATRVSALPSTADTPADIDHADRSSHNHKPRAISIFWMDQSTKSVINHRLSCSSHPSLSLSVDIWIVVPILLGYIFLLLFAIVLALLFQ